jgi:hypothetical protein
MEYLDVHGMTILKWILKTQWQRKNWIYVSQNGEESRVLVNTVMSERVPLCVEFLDLLSKY